MAGLTDDQLETLYKSGVAESHYAGLRAVFDAGYNTGAGATTTGDVSTTAASPNLTQETIITP